MGFRMPAEWERHEGTWLGWPHELTDWPGKFAPIPWAFAEMVRLLSQVEKIFLLVPFAGSAQGKQYSAAEKRVRGILRKAGAKLESVEFFVVPTDRGWMRDSGPICVKNSTGEVAYNNFVFNGWAKYPNHKKDAQVVRKMNARRKRRIFLPEHKGRRVVLEGGSIDVNGKGTLLTTEECLLSKVQQRNPGFRREDYEQVFATYLGIRQVIWLGKGIAGDDTHGHVDDITRFVSPDTIVTMTEPDPKDKNHAPLKENLYRLRSATDLDGKPFRIVELPMPALVSFEGRRLPASYGNFYIANGVVLVPVFNDPRDRAELNILPHFSPG